MIWNKKVFFLAILVTFLSACFVHKDKNISVEEQLYNYIPQDFSYDTIQEEFLFENSISSYVEEDAIMKAGGYIISSENIDKELYLKGYYIINLTYLKDLSRKNIPINYDPKSISHFKDSIYLYSIKQGDLYGETNINPFCGGYYKKVKMKAEVLYIGLVPQRIPLFLNCDEYQAYSKKNKRSYEVIKLPTYVITKIFN